MKVRDLLSKQVFISLANDESGFNCRERFGKCLSRCRFLAFCKRLLCQLIEESKLHGGILQV